MKPILFNGDMVQAILEGRKTVTRRVIKPQPTHCTMSMAGLVVSEKPIEISDGIIKAANAEVRKPPFEAGDILYVRETWAKRESDRCNGVETGRCPFETCETAPGPCFNEKYIYKATDSLPTYGGKWHPSIHMPKEAARLFLRVTDVRAERLHDITDEQAKAEGVRGFFLGMGESGYAVRADSKTFYEGPVGAFASLWNSTIKPADHAQYGWNANPWVWVIAFKRISRGEALGGKC